MISDTVIADTRAVPHPACGCVCVCVCVCAPDAGARACWLACWLPVRASQPALEAGARSH